MTDTQLRLHFAGGWCGIAIIGGAVSGGLLVIDVEFLDYFEEWAALVETQAPGLLARLPTIRTPGKDESGGRHVYARSAGPTIGSDKLARMSRAEAERRTGSPGRTTAIEVKAEGGYVLTVGCPAACHPSGRLYEHAAGPPLESTPTITESEVAVLLASARALEGGDKFAGDRATGEGGADTNRPGDDFNRRADWRRDVLGPEWKTVREKGDILYLCRPGKADGVSATVGYCRSVLAGPKLYVFSTNAEPFEPEKAYSKFEAYTLLNHGNDFSAAARELARQGYGEQSAPAGRFVFGSNGQARQADGAAGAPADRVTLGRLTLVLGQPHQSPGGKLTVPVTVFRGDVVACQVLLTSAASGRREPARVLLSLLPEGDPAALEIDAALTRLIGLAAARLASEAGGTSAPRGKLYAAVAAFVREHFVPARRIGRRLYLATFGADFDVPSFLSLVNTELLAAGEAATGKVRRQDEDAFRRMVVSEMRIVFADLLTTLRWDEPEDVPMHSAERQALAEAVLALWSTVKCLTRTVERDGTETTTNIGLIGLVRGLLASRRVSEGSWTRVHSAHEAFVRRHSLADETGEVTGAELLLGFNAGLVVSMGVKLPEGINRFNLLKRGRKAGLFRDLPPDLPANADRTRRGRTRLIVLDQSLTNELMEDASADDSSNCHPGTPADDR
jgi:hypothetical protein